MKQINRNDIVGAGFEPARKNMLMNSIEMFPQRQHIRLHDYDYSWPWSYFVTICTNEKRCLLGSVTNSIIELNEFGEIVKSCWEDMPNHYPEIDNEVFVVMPNHIHGIITIRDFDRRSGYKPDPTKRYPLSEIVRGFKTYSSRKINALRNSPGKPVWQRSFYEHIIRDESEYHQIGEYITYNPAKWDEDGENPNIGLKNYSVVSAVKGN